MGALPKRKISKGRRNRRRAHDALRPPELVACPSCGKKMRPHRVCLSCGQYNGRTVFEMED
ncbi:MAG: 50S ribosomal protein L32 [Anaerolineales bacterium]|nr:50S ribosomal protein L32 [Anaerolineales bacterium]NOR82149.1 50S ribosomal protein L32 [Ardenticatenales bacterium]